MNMEGIAPGLIEVSSWYLCGETEENRGISEVRVARVPAENRTEQFPNTSPECYRCANLLAFTTVLPCCAGQRRSKCCVFWDVMTCSPVEVHGRFGPTYSILLLVLALRPVAGRCYDTPVNYATARRQIRGDSTLHNYCCEDLK
jgi:hypothetical protein